MKSTILVYPVVGGSTVQASQLVLLCDTLPVLWNGTLLVGVPPAAPTTIAAVTLMLLASLSAPRDVAVSVVIPSAPPSAYVVDVTHCGGLGGSGGLGGKGGLGGGGAKGQPRP